MRNNNATYVHEIELGSWFFERAERAHDKNKQEWNHLKAGIDAYSGENRK